jgi:type II secretory ATPase GspE/PulE/Tfp pilus assembly ATPase PilB-like protein
LAERLYSTYQVADLLGALPSTVNEWIEKGWLASQRFSDGPVRITERSLLEFLEQRGIDIETVMAKAVLREARDADEAPVTTDRDAELLLEAAQALPAEQEAAPDAASEIAEALLRDGVNRGVSAIHLEPEPGGLGLRLRTGKILRDRVNFRLRLPLTAGPALIARLKSMAGLDQAQCRLPQAGGFALPMEGREIQFRVSTCPVVHGERMVIHILDPERVLPELSGLGLPASEEVRLRELLAEPCGVILLVAPSRKERATTLRAMVKALNSSDRSVLTIETSTELMIEGVNQSRIDPAAGYSFAQAVEAFAGQDADVILIEEVRDPRSAAAIVQLASEGRMILAGMAARRAAAALATFAEMCGEPYLLSSTLLAVMEQRTVARLCDGCKTRAVAVRDLLEGSGLKDVTFPVFSGAGCSRCGNTGYSGTVTLLAITEVGRALARSIRLGGDAGALEQAALLVGLKSLSDVALESLRAGATTVEEIVRVLPRRRMG